MTRGERGIVWACSAMVAALTFAPSLAGWDATGGGDWPQFHHFWEATRVALLEHHEWPVWDPYHCGGVTLWGQPQSMHMAPTYWLTGLVFGTARGSKIFVMLHAAVGLVGAYELARRERSEAASALSAAMWALGGFFAWRVAEGHAGFLALHYLPWAILAARRVQDDVRAAVALAAVLALQIYEGGVYALPFTGLAVLLETGVRAIGAPGALRRARGLAVAAVLFVALGAARLWPIAVTATRAPRPTSLEDGQSPRELLRALTSIDAPEPWTHTWAWAEHAAFIGVTGLGLAMVGAAFALRDRASRPLLAGAALFGALTLGAHGPASPWSLLHALPGFASLHVPSRFAGVLTLYLALLAGLGLDRCAELVRRAGGQRTVRLLMWPVALAVALEVIGSARPIAATWRGPPLGGARAPRHHLVEHEDYLAHFMSYPSRNVGSASCYDPLPWVVPDALWDGDVAQARASPAGVATLHREARTSSRYTVVVDARASARLVLNQRFDPGWRSQDGRVVDDGGRLAIDVPPGRRRVDARFVPRDLPWSVVISLGGLAACAALVARRRRRLKRAGAASKAGRP